VGLLDSISDERGLLSAWLHLRNSVPDDIPPKAVRTFEESVAKNIARLSDEIRSNKWTANAAGSVRIPKATGGHRTLTIPSVKDRIVERVIANVIDEIVDPLLSPWCFAYRRGLSANDAVVALYEARDDGAAFVLRTDIKNCFDSISHERLLVLLRSIIEDTSVLRMLESIVSRGAAAAVSGYGLAQGSPVSPVLSNLYLNVADQFLLQRGQQMIRYADDLAVPALNEADGHGSLGLVREAFAQIELNLSPEKTELAAFSDGVNFLGRRLLEGERPLLSTVQTPIDTTLYVATDGALLRRKGKRIRIERPEKKPVSVPVSRTRQVVVIGRVGLTTPFLQIAMQNQIEIIFVSSHGNYFGRMDGLVSSDPFLREQQYRRMRDREFCNELSKRMLRTKILNQRRLLMHLLRRANREPLSAPITALAEIADRIHGASSWSEAMGHEGAAARQYFFALGAVCGSEWAFTTRQRRPPPDPVNSMLSFGYTLLFQEAVTACLAAGLDPYASFIHRPRIGRQSLALDLMEEFRPCIIDSVVMRMIRTRMISPLDFEMSGEDKPMCRLSKSARNTMLEALETRFLTEFSHPSYGRKMSWRQALGLHAKSLAVAVSAGADAYKPVIWK